MRPRRTARIFAALLLVCAACQAALAAEPNVADGFEEAGAVPLPDIARGRGEACVEDSDFMRRNHMDLLTHQRDETVHLGLRGKPYSLKECIDCHAVQGTDAVPVTAADPRHFCRSCHDYAAVSIDCFECHASRPVAVEAGPPEDKRGR